MTRLATALYWQVIYQHRNGFYVASVVTVAMLVALLSALPNTIDLATKRVAVAVFTIFAVQITTFFFIGGILLLERGEGVLSALAVSPLPAGEYLLARVATLSVLATLETLVIGAAIAGSGLDIALFVVGALALAALFACLGFAFFSRYAGLNEALMPSVLATIVLSLPALALASPTPFFAWNLHPTHAAIQLVARAFGMDQTFGVLETLSLAVWIVATAALAHTAARRLLAAAELQ
jgi:fluoroquinolone transport system permease protein